MNERLPNELELSDIRPPIYPQAESVHASAVIDLALKRQSTGCELLFITPEQAQAILSRWNLGNRTPVENKIEEYTDAILEGRWYITGDTIKFSTDKAMLDGQNRLMACVRAGRPIFSYVVFGIQPDAFIYMDRGGVRTAANVLAMKGYQNASAVAAGVKWAKLIETKKVKLHSSFKPYEILNMVRGEFEGIEIFALPAGRIYTATGHPQSTTIGCLYHFNLRSKSLQEGFSLAWEKGSSQQLFRPVQLMKDRMAAIKAQTAGRVYEPVRVALAIIAWNLVCQKLRGKKEDFIWDTTKEVPEIRQP